MKKRILALILGILTIFIIFFNLKTSEKLELYFCNVGQGDGLVIRTTGDELIVVDGGPDRSILDCLDGLSVFKSRKISKIVLSHPHMDHISGLLEVFDRYQIGEVIVTSTGHTSKEYKVFMEKLQDKHLKVVVAGESVVNYRDLSLEVVWPLSEYQTKNLNDSSLVLRLVSGSDCFLLTGDAGSDFEKYYLTNYGQCGGLKVAHHGSRFATSQEFVEHLDAKLAVISSGENNYGHPNSEVIDRLSRLGVEVLRTDVGTVKIVSDGSGWYIADTK